MDYSEFSTAFQSALAPQILSILAALGILIIGWLVAVVLRAGVRRGLVAWGTRHLLTFADSHEKPLSDIRLGQIVVQRIPNDGQR